jgi:outer membrane immunogenic protein
VQQITAKSLAAGVAMLVSIAAQAADVRLPIYKSAAYVPTWTGFYVGGNVGAAWGRSDFSTNPNCPPEPVDAVFCNLTPTAANGVAVAAAGTGRLSSNGFTGGVQAGYNWQAGAVVWGAEADFNFLSLKRSLATAGTFPVPFLGTRFALTEESRTDWLATLRARMGVTVVPNVLLYATAGLAITDSRFASAYSDNAVDAVFPGGAGSASLSGVRTGWTAGGGLEWMLAGNWTLKAEYLYVAFASESFAVPLTNGVAFRQTMFVDADFSAHVARVGFNYKLGYAPASAVYK